VGVAIEPLSQHNVQGPDVRHHHSRRYAQDLFAFARKPIEVTPWSLLSALFRKERAPALRADFSINHFAGVRRLEGAAAVAALRTFRLVLV
jgi:hypothetical protein